MQRPVKSYIRISTQFGATPDPGVFGKHAGTDYACPVGTPVYAAISGKVTQSFFGTEAGGQIEITDSTYSVRTLHMSRLDVKLGQQVIEGQQVGLSGDTGVKTTGPHCHFDVRKAGTAWDHSFSDYFDPEKLINQGELEMTDAQVYQLLNERDKRLDTLTKNLGDLYTIVDQTNKALTEVIKPGGRLDKDYANLSKLINK